MFFRGLQPAGGVVRSCVESFQGLCRCRGVQPAGGVVRSCVERCKELCRCIEGCHKLCKKWSERSCVEGCNDFCRGM